MDKKEIFTEITTLYANSKRFYAPPVFKEVLPVGEYGATTISKTSSYVPQVPIIPEPGEKIALSWSGGKDSCYAYCKAKELGLNISYIILFTNTDGSFSFSPPYTIALIEAQLANFDIPIIKIPSFGNPQEILIHLFDFLLSHDVHIFGPSAEDNIVFSIAHTKGIHIFDPMIVQDEEQMLIDFLAVDIQANVVAIDNDVLDRTYLGAEINQDFYMKLQQLPGFSEFCGEYGAYHTIVTNCKFFKKPILLKDFYTFQIGSQIIRYYI